MVSILLQRIKEEQDGKGKDVDMKNYYQGMASHELEFVDSIKLILDAGWCIDQQGF